jgi:hypothetical protein
MVFSQLNPPIPVFVPINSHGFPSGDGLAIGILDYSCEYHIIWGVGYDRTGEIWWVPNPLVRLQKNTTLGRTIDG